MILKQTTMQLSTPQKVIPKRVMLWKEVGLCVHKSDICMGGYTISHFNSGKSVLRYIKTQQQAKDYMTRLTKFMKDWTFTLREWEVMSSEDRGVIKEKVGVIQREILRKE